MSENNAIGTVALLSVGVEEPKFQVRCLEAMGSCGRNLGFITPTLATMWPSRVLVDSTQLPDSLPHDVTQLLYHIRCECYALLPTFFSCWMASLTKAGVLVGRQVGWWPIAAERLLVSGRQDIPTFW